MKAQASADVIGRIKAKRDEKRAQRGNGAAALHGITTRDLQAKTFAPIRYVVPGYIVEGLTILGGKPKLGKSWLCLDMACAVAAGGSAFGSVECEAGDVLYAALEDNERRLKRRLEAILPWHDWPERLTLWTEMPRLNDGGLEALRDWIAGQPAPRLAILDVLARIRPPRKSNEQPYEADYRAIEALQNLASETGIAIVVVHHVRKEGADDPLDTLSGTLGLGGAADAVLVLDRSFDGVTLKGRGRDLEEVETAVRFEPDLRRWTILGDPAEQRRTAERRAILDALRDAGEPMTPKELADATGARSTNVRQLLFKMAKAGEVERAERRGSYAAIPSPPR